MARETTMLFFFFFFILSFSLPNPIHSLHEPDPDSVSTVYETLAQYGLPKGLLPDSVIKYTLSNDGRFEVVLADKPCYIQFDYLVSYDKTITGRIGYGSITDLKGIKVKRFLIWFDVDEIKVDLPPSDSIYFLVGFINKRLDLHQFKTVRACRDNAVSGFCGISWNRFSKLPETLDEAGMLITE